GALTVHGTVINGGGKIRLQVHDESPGEPPHDYVIKDDSISRDGAAPITFTDAKSVMVNTNTTDTHVTFASPGRSPGTDALPPDSTNIGDTLSQQAPEGHLPQDPGITSVGGTFSIDSRIGCGPKFGPDVDMSRFDAPAGSTVTVDPLRSFIQSG